MAFSTQRDFFHVPFMNETTSMQESHCKKACVKLKSYNSSTDDRSWALDGTKQSKFLTDLVSCNVPPFDADGVNDGDHSSNRNRDPGRGGDERGDGGTERGGLERSGGSGASTSRPARDVRLTDTDSGVEFGNSVLPRNGLPYEDSILGCCNKNLGRINDILSEKEHIEKQLEVSNERLRTAYEENDKIKEIMNQKFDRSHSNDFYNKIKKLVSLEKINKTEETELLHIFRKMEDVNKAYEVLKAENSYLKRLLEKLSERVRLDNISMEQEKSTDIGYLQTRVNSLHKEVLIMRKMEDDKLKSPQADDNKNHFSNQDAENLKAIIKERNELRRQCQKFKDLEKGVEELQKKARAADQMSGSLSSHLDNQTRYIYDMEHEMCTMQKYYEKEMEKLKFNEDILKSQIEEMKDDLCSAQCQAQKAKCLQMDIGCLRNELLQRDITLNDYDCQYRQLMSVIEELQHRTIQDLQDTETQTGTDLIDDLAFFARATLGEIIKEVDKRGSSGNLRHESEEYMAYGMEQDPNRDPPAKTDANDSQAPADSVPLKREREREDYTPVIKPSEVKLIHDHRDVDEMKPVVSDRQENRKATYDKPTQAAGRDKPLADKESQTEPVSTSESEKYLAEIERLEKVIKQLTDENNELNKLLKEAGSGNFETLRAADKQKIDALEKELAKLNKDHAEKLTELTNKLAKLDKDLDEHAKEAANVGKELEQSIEVVKEISDYQMKNQQLANVVNTIDQRTFDELNNKLLVETEKNRKCQMEMEALKKEMKNKDLNPKDVTKELVTTMDKDPKAAAVLQELKSAADNTESADIDVKTAPTTTRPSVAQTAPTSVTPSPKGVKNGARRIVAAKDGGLAAKSKRPSPVVIPQSGVVTPTAKNLLPKSKFGFICHKLLHQDNVTVKELVYMHKKIYCAAEKLCPGEFMCLINAERCSQDNEQFCCNCKNVVCCTNSEEMIKDRVCRLERDIEVAKEYLDNMKINPPSPRSSMPTCDADNEYRSENGVTYRPNKPAPKCCKKKRKI